MPDAAERVRRHREIRELVAGLEIGSQDELARALGKSGFSVTQSTLSRDLRELRILRVPVEGGGYRYVAEEGVGANGEGPSSRLRSFAPVEIVGIEANEVTVVVRTLVGRAQGVAVYLDELRLPEVLGTIAGDDTILVLPATTKKTDGLRHRLAELFGLQRREAVIR